MEVAELRFIDNRLEMRASRTIHSSCEFREFNKGGTVVRREPRVAYGTEQLLFKTNKSRVELNGLLFLIVAIFWSDSSSWT